MGCFIPLQGPFGRFTTAAHVSRPIAAIKQVLSGDLSTGESAA